MSMTLDTKPGFSPVSGLFALANSFYRNLSKAAFDRAGLALMGLVVTFVVTVGIAKPEYNWDMSAYIASAMNDGTRSAAELHRSTWSQIEARASETQMYRLKAQNPYNVHQYENPADFVSMLPMYDVKVGYIALLRFVGGIMGMVDAAIAITIATTLATGILLIWWMRQGGFEQSAPLLAAGLLLSGYFSMARGVTPDNLFALIALGGIFAMLRGRDWLGAALIFAAFLVRPDNIIFLFAMVLASAVLGARLMPALTAFGCAFVSYFWITSGEHHPGWWAHFYFSCVEIQMTMTGFSPDFSIMTYLKGVARGVSVSLQDNKWPMLLLVLGFGWAMLARSGRGPNKAATVTLLALFLCMAGKFVVFPLPDDRTYFVYLVAMIMILLETWKPRLDNAAR
ncbi:MAG: hypothetical protein AAF468_07250 [Pseudomonadota bacterium]